MPDRQLFKRVRDNCPVWMEQKLADMRPPLQGLRKFADMKGLPPTIVNKLIQHIEIHNPEKVRSSISKGGYLLYSERDGEFAGRTGDTKAGVTEIRSTLQPFKQLTT